ncbi:hypothetical protein DV736_g2576, partial [Chaetothyriales sp. CBS 134916]
MRRRFLTQASKSWKAQLAAPVHVSGQDAFRCSRCLSASTSRPATTLPVTGTGPPPAPPKPHVSSYDARVDEKRRKVELLKQGQELRASQTSKSSPLKRRFWKEVHVEETPDGYRVLLDKRPVRLPSKAPILVPPSKPHLAHAIAIEWDMLESAEQATKNHNIPLTSIVSRAQDIADADANAANGPSIREAILTTMLRYLDTDTLLCWAPESDQDGRENRDQPQSGGGRRSSGLRQLQIDTAKPIMAYLTAQLWPGVDIKPALEGSSIIPTSQSELTRSVISGWISSLPAYELAALERAVLAGKSLLVATRLLIEWSEEFRYLQQDKDNGPRFGIEQAAKAANVEVNWQTTMWGEVEDTHDVDNEDIRRQLGSSVLLVSGTK